MHPIDWIFLLIPILLVVTIGIYTRSYVKSVADFLSGGRMAGRYLLAIAGGEMQAGAVVFVASFEMFASSGFTIGGWWAVLNVPVGVIIGIVGFVTYRFRETRAMTLAQFFEIRYNKSFRLCTGVMGFIAGICNFGIIPAIGARFFVYFLGFPPEISFGALCIPTYIPLMGLLLSATVVLAISGGIVTVMVTNCVEGIISQLFYVVIIGCLILTFSWPQISHVLLDRPHGLSLMNPFDIGKASDFNIWYVLMCMFGSIYGTMAWQNASAYNSASITPHEGRMGGLLGRCRDIGKGPVVTLLAACALAFIYHPDFAAQSQAAHAAINHLSDPNIQRQMSVPIAVSHMLPIGIKGMLCAVLLMGIFGGDATHLHSWGGIFIQDVLVPLRKKPFTPSQHIRALRLSIIGVALFAFIFGSLFRQTEYVVMWWSVTMALYIGGAGSAIIGGLYWKKGTTSGAFAALFTGSAIASSGVIARQVMGASFPFNGAQVSFFAALSAITVYIAVSLLTNREDFNLDRMLHRGCYAVAEIDDRPILSGRENFFSRLLGFDEHYTRADRWIAGSLLGWSLFWCGVVVVGSLWNLLCPWPNSVWSTYWHVTSVGIPILLCLIATVWFTWGGLRDMQAFFRRLREKKANHLDDGTVLGHLNADDVPTLSGDRQKEAVAKS